MTTGFAATGLSAASGQQIWVKAPRDQAAELPTLASLAEEAAAALAKNNLSNQALAAIKNFILGEANRYIGRELNKLRPDQREIFFQTMGEVFSQHCDSNNWRSGNPVYPSLETNEAIDRTIEKFRAAHWNPGPLMNIRNYVARRAAPFIGSQLSGYDKAQQQAVFSTVTTRRFAESCGYDGYIIPQLPGANAPIVLTAGQTATFTLRAGNPPLPGDLLVAFLNQGTPDPSVTGKVKSLSEDKMTAVISVTADPSAAEGDRLVVVGSANQLDLPPIQAVALTVIPPSSLGGQVVTASAIPNSAVPGNTGQPDIGQPNQQTWFKIGDQATALPTLSRITETVGSYFESNNLPTRPIARIRDVLNKGNSFYEKELNKIPQEQKALYFQKVAEVFNEHCDSRNWHSGDPVYPLLTEAIDRTTRTFTNYDWTPLVNIDNYFKANVYPKIDSNLASYRDEVLRGKFSVVANELFAGTCGYERFTYPLPSGLGQALTAGTSTTINIRSDGSLPLPNDLIIVFPDAAGEPDPNLFGLVQSLSPDKMTAAVLVTAYQSAAPGRRIFALGSASQAPLPPVQAEALEVRQNITIGGAGLATDTTTGDRDLDGRVNAKLYLNNTLKAGALLSLGAASNVSIPYDHRAAGDEALPNLVLKFNLGTPDEPVIVIGSGNDALVRKSSRFELLANLQGGVQDTIHDTRSSYLLSAGLGLGLRYKIMEAEQLSLDLWNELGASNNSLLDPNKFFFSGRAEQWTAGLALNSDFRTNWLTARASLERQFTSFHWDDHTFPGGFSGQAETWKAGLAGRFNYTARSTSSWAPEIKVNLAWLFAGNTALPDSAAGWVYEKRTGFEANARVDFPRIISPQFYFFGGLSRLQQESADHLSPLSAYSLGAGVKDPDLGLFEARGDLTYNPGLYYGGKIGLATLTYGLPERFKYASALGISLIGYQIDDQSGFGADIFVKLPFGPVRQKALKPEFNSEQNLDGIR